MKSGGDRNDELPLFQLLSEDADRLGNSLRDILVPFRQLCFTDEIAQGLPLVTTVYSHA